MIEGLRTGLEGLLAGAWTQLGGTLLMPGSTHSIAALAVTLACFVVLAVPRGRKRPVRLAVLRRVLLPRRLFGSASGRTDLAYFLFGLLFAGALVGWAVFSAEQVRHFAAGVLGAPPAPRLPGWANALIATPILFLAYEFAYWLDHWLMHRVPILWHFHKVHHQAESLSIFTNGRVHPLESIGFYNLVALILGLTGALLEQVLGVATPLALGGTNLLIMTAAILVTHLQHSHLWVGFGPRWGRVLLGPAHHQIHHSADPRHFNTNLGSSLALFDRLFGTFHMPAPKREALRFGVEDGETDPHGVRAALFEPFAASARSLARVSIRASTPPAAPDPSSSR
ncbi:sterol desaturase family protein [Sphingomonas sp. M1-B02]|uniref:sterol desaturase family protein n=1 Tax=Sphingomonas sp. M1-B02 TaxID=3114300 RepID=UPI002240BAE8|nr:sterol desaturase family protein [Sphingomonas sp. S6-11]UZK65566.1 sterol desaturase family protein [Sphingomonas sp. S6-11]